MTAVRTRCLVSFAVALAAHALLLFSLRPGVNRPSLWPFTPMSTDVALSGNRPLERDAVAVTLPTGSLELVWELGSADQPPDHRRPVFPPLTGMTAGRLEMSRLGDAAAEAEALAREREALASRARLEALAAAPAEFVADLVLAGAQLRLAPIAGAIPLKDSQALAQQLAEAQAPEAASPREERRVAGRSGEGTEASPPRRVSPTPRAQPTPRPATPAPRPPPPTPAAPTAVPTPEPTPEARELARAATPPPSTPPPATPPPTAAAIAPPQEPPPAPEPVPDARPEPTPSLPPTASPTPTPLPEPRIIPEIYPPELAVLPVPPPQPTRTQTPALPDERSAEPPPSPSEPLATTALIPGLTAAPDRGPGVWTPNANVFFSRLTAHLFAANQAALAQAVRAGPKLTLDVRFFVNREGRVLGAQVIRSSGIPELDRKAEQTILDASPLPRLPDDLPQRQLELSFPVEVYR